jgi:hypothetical protein
MIDAGVGRVEAERAAGQAEMRGEAESLMGRFAAGDVDALKGVIQLMPEGTLRERLERMTPRAELRQRFANVGETLRGFGKRVQEKTAAEARQRASEAIDQDLQHSYEVLEDSNRDYRESKQEARQAGARKKQEAEQGARDARKAAKARRAAALEGQADELLAHGPAIVGAAYGPVAAEMAQRASPDEVKEMRERTIRALEQGAAPDKAILEAFRTVAEEVIRANEARQQFGAQIRGEAANFRGQLRSTTQNFMDTMSY